MEIKNLRASRQSIEYFMLVFAAVLVMAAFIVLTAYTDVQALLSCDDAINRANECLNDTTGSGGVTESGSNLLVRSVFGVGVLIAVATLIVIIRWALKMYRGNLFRGTRRSPKKVS